jgi:hypothetical protein
MTGLAVAEDRLAERIDKQPDPVAPSLRRVSAELRVLGRKDDAFALGEDAPTSQRHHDARDHRSEPCGDGQEHAIDVTKRRRQTILGDDRCQSPRGAPVGTDPQHLVGESLHQLAPGRVGYQSTKAVELPTFSTCCVSHSVTKQAVRQGDRLVDQRHLSVIRGEMRVINDGVHHLN